MHKNRQNLGDRGQREGAVMGGAGGTSERWDVLSLHLSGGYMGPCRCEKSINASLMRLHFPVCKLYLNVSKRLVPCPPGGSTPQL